MSKPEPKFDWSDLDAELERAKVTAGQPPEGAFSVSQFAEHRNVGIELARRTILRLCKTGKVRSMGYFLSPTQHRTQYWKWVGRSSNERGHAK